jgi:hypothetical protein
VWAVGHLIGDLLPAVGRKAVQDNHSRVGFGPRRLFTNRAEDRAAARRT